MPHATYLDCGDIIGATVRPFQTGENKYYADITCMSRYDVKITSYTYESLPVNPTVSYMFCIVYEVCYQRTL